MPIENAEELNRLFLFELLTPEEMKDVSDAFIEKIYPTGGKIFSEKDKGETMFVVRVGSVRITKQDNDQEKELAILMPGDFFGEITLFDYAFRTATAIVMEGTSLLAIKRHAFNDLFLRKPALAAKVLYQMMTEMSRRLRRNIVPDRDIIF